MLRKKDKMPRGKIILRSYKMKQEELLKIILLITPEKYT
jgi:hypothetical protein